MLSIILSGDSHKLESGYEDDDDSLRLINRELYIVPEIGLIEHDVT